MSVPGGVAQFAGTLGQGGDDKAGISSPPTTWSEYITDAQKVTTANPGVYGADPADKFDPWKFIWSYTGQLGGRFVAADGKSGSMDSPK